jgi:hypothetical protein
VKHYVIIRSWWSQGVLASQSRGKFSPVGAQATLNLEHSSSTNSNGNFPVIRSSLISTNDVTILALELMFSFPIVYVQ